MKTYKLSFGEIIILKDNLAEVIINEGVLLDIEMVYEYHNFLLKHLTAPFSLLINKKYPYTYTFRAQKEIGNLEEINLMAVTVEGFNGKKSTEFLIALNKSNNWNIKTFSTRLEALSWIEKHQ
ncbi:hypothetical protein HNV10_16355 [Winogradskyella litoriviva]|uniref:STAS/SEC14 domain-containing protein n=1 Tax=Winogradskyella litoriviva TaxID=1220182 RepID=A0ABX2E8X9_9FLAO|nr:hypothetical protein [Winogradskyella litoriviva]NRD24827.1 hypothetical protein [Winogradskyella litoriviva]